MAETVTRRNRGRRIEGHKREAGSKWSGKEREDQEVKLENEDSHSFETAVLFIPHPAGQHSASWYIESKKIKVRL